MILSLVSLFFFFLKTSVVLSSSSCFKAESVVVPIQIRTSKIGYGSDNPSKLKIKIWVWAQVFGPVNRVDPNQPTKMAGPFS